MSVYNVGPVGFAGVSQVTATRGTNDPEVGTVIRSGDEEYIYCYNVGSSTINPGHGVIVSAVTGYSVTVSSVTAVDFFVAVCKHAAVPTGSYGWLVTKGFCAVEMGADNSAAAGQVLCAGVDGTWALKTTTTGLNGAYDAQHTQAKAMEAIASGASGMAFVKCF